MKPFRALEGSSLMNVTVSYSIQSVLETSVVIVQVECTNTPDVSSRHIRRSPDVTAEQECALTIGPLLQLLRNSGLEHAGALPPRKLATQPVSHERP